MFEENWVYRILVIICLCVLLVWTYLTNEETLLNYISGKFILDTRLIWQVSIFALLSIVLFYLMESTLDYKSKNEVLKRYLEQLQSDIDSGRDAFKEFKTESGEEILKLGSFIVTISEMAKQLSSVLQTDELLKVILRKAIDLLNCQKAAIYKIDENNNLVYVASSGYEMEKITAISLKADDESGLAGYAAKTGEFISRDSAVYDPAKGYLLDSDKLEISYCQPIVYESKTLAVLCTGEASKELTKEQIVKLLSTLANFGAVALTNTELVEKIREQSRRDGLTWLYNHQYFQEKMDVLLSSAYKENKPLGFIIMDIDHFKKFNDTYGHQAGDFVLKKTADILESQMKPGDLIARYGGEEFVAVLPNKDKKEAFKTAEKIRQAFEDNIFKFDGNDLKVTVSAGVSSFEPGKKDWFTKNVIIRYADNALYEAKEKGRNKVIIAKD